MQSSPKSVGLFVALVVSALLLVGWPRVTPEAPAEPEPVSLFEKPEGPVFTVDGDVWRLPQHGIRMSLPADWTPIERFGRPYLHVDPDDPRAGNFNVLWLPNLRGLDFEGLEEENRVAMENSPDLELLSIEETLVTDLPALRIDYRGTPNGGERMHFMSVVFLDGNRQIVVTAAIREEEWAGVESTVLACLGSLERLP